MRNKLIIVLLSAFSIFANNLFAVQSNFLDPQRYSFEDSGESMYYQQSDTYWSVTNEKSTEGGSYSLKFSSTAALSGTEKAKNGGITLPSGNYTFKVNVWKAAGADIKGFIFIINTPYQVVDVNIENIEFQKWVEVAIPVTINQDVDNSGSKINIKADHVGSGTMYLDDFGFWGEKGEEPVTLPAISSTQTTNGALLNLPAGEYEVKLNVWKSAETTISTICSSISNPNTNLTWDLSAATAGEWSELTQTMLIKDSVENASLKLWVNNNTKKGGGTGDVYIDNIEFMRANAYTAVTGISISENELSLFINDEQNLSHSIQPQNASCQTASWISANPAIATVNANGLVKGISEGTTKISVYSSEGYFVATCTVTVKKDNTPANNILHNSVKISPNPFTNRLYINLNNTHYQHFKLYDLSGQAMWMSTITGNKITLSPPYSSVPAGIYLLKLSGKQSVKTVRVIRK